VDAALWNIGQPDGFGAGRETCVMLNAERGKLFDLPCNVPGGSFLCQLAEKDLPCR